MRGFMSSSNANKTSSASKTSDASTISSDKNTGDSMSSISSVQPSHMTPPESTPPPAPRPVTQEQEETALPTAVIGPKIRFKGELAGEEDLLIQGQVEGTIDLKNNTLTVGKQGVVKANVIAKTVTIEGTVEGDLFGQERISILASSNVKGNIIADRVILEDGAKFRGSIDMNISSHKDKFDSARNSDHAIARNKDADLNGSPTKQNEVKA